MFVPAKNVFRPKAASGLSWSSILAVSRLPTSVEELSSAQTATRDIDSAYRFGLSTDRGLESQARRAQAASQSMACPALTVPGAECREIALAGREHARAAGLVLGPDVRTRVARQLARGPTDVHFVAVAGTSLRVAT